MRERLDKATFELQFEQQYDVTVVNDDLQETLHRCEALVDGFLSEP
jgi:guanylate kinase